MQVNTYLHTVPSLSHPSSSVTCLEGVAETVRDPAREVTFELAFDCDFRDGVLPPPSAFRRRSDISK